MMAKLDWSAIESSIALGGYEVSAVLSDSTALLALVALNLISAKYMWDGYTDFDDVETAVDTAISEIMNGSSAMGDCVLIAEAVATSDVASLTLDDFDAGDFASYELVISGMKSNFTGNTVDHVIMQLNGNSTPGSYNSYARLSYITNYPSYAFIGTKPGLVLLWGAATSLDSDESLGDCRVFLPDPQGDDMKRCNYRGDIFGFSDSKMYIKVGVGVFLNTAVIEEITILPDAGTLFKVSNASSLYPSKLRMALYGYR